MTTSECSCQAEVDKVHEIVEKWRERLADISWFMRCLNEYIARKANEEDGCSGRFWEGRFKSQALLDEQGLLTCMAYVDLNPVRAAIADCPEQSDFTSIQQRISEYAEQQKNATDSTASTTPRLKPFSVRQKDSHCSIAFDYADYLELLDWTGRCCREDKRGHIPAHLPPILQRLHIDQNAWLRAMQPEGLRRSRAMGHFERLKTFARDKGSAWISSGNQFKALFA
ncbi:hypothetical protein [Oceanospirillum beijerinckii]|uniref:hypothetical protein n=1 Tax=Oceanospirillum beijerinckii TaxID=64976 RepID=UPI0003F66ABF|nr:hypothetical protein [Oceanospirillum beijerinckii]